MHRARQQVSGGNMNKWSFWQKDWFVGLLVALVFFLGANSGLMQSLERKAYDLGVLASSRAPSDKIAVIAIDEQSIANLGRWPWPRAIHARMLDVLAAGHPKVIGYTAFFFEPQVDAGLNYIYKIAELIGNSKLKDTKNPEEQAELAKLGALLQEAAQNLDNDQKLSASIANANDVLLPIFFELGEPQGKPDQELPDYVLRDSLTNVKDPGGLGESPLPARGVLAPIPALGSKALAIGHLNSFPDVDGAYRTVHIRKAVQMADGQCLAAQCRDRSQHTSRWQWRLAQSAGIFHIRETIAQHIVRQFLIGFALRLTEFEKNRQQHIVRIGYACAELLIVVEILRRFLQQGAELGPVSYTHLRAHETDSYLVCRLLLEKKKKTNK